MFYMLCVCGWGVEEKGRVNVHRPMNRSVSNRLKDPPPPPPPFKLAFAHVSRESTSFNELAGDATLQTAIDQLQTTHSAAVWWLRVMVLIESSVVSFHFI